MNAATDIPQPGRGRHLLGWLDDHASPMVVKELRQGVKSKAFGFSFMLMQGLMVFCIVLYAVAFSRENDQTAFNAIFWVFLGSSLLFVTPLRALGALQQEVKGNTLELIFLSRLTAWRIVAGKWMALYAQNLLIATAAMPYLLLRYFLGGFDIFFDLNILFWVLMGSAALTAVGVALSAFRTQAVRVIVGIVGVLAPYMFGITFFGMSMGGRSVFGGAGLTVSQTIGVIATVIVGVLLALNWGAGKISPPAENYSLRKRLLVFLLLAMILCVCVSTQESGYLIFASIVVVFAGIDALLEAPRFIPTLYTGFARRGPAGRVAALFLLPGWPAGLFFVCMAFVLLFAAAGAIDLFSDLEKANVMIALPGALLFPLAVVLLIRRDPKHLGAAYFGVQLLCFLVGVAALCIEAVYSHTDLWPLSFLPPTALFMAIADQADGPVWAVVGAVMAAASFVVLIARTRPHLARQRELLLRKRDTLPTDAPSGDPPA